VLVLGGCRSGKSRYAEQWINDRFDCKTYIATLEERDDKEMRDRIGAHRKRRGRGWVTVEEPLRLVEVLQENRAGTEVFLVDCLTMWLTNCMMRGVSDSEIEMQVSALQDAVDTFPATIVFVANEVGLGIVPDSSLGRRFRDMAGWVNQQIASQCDQVFFVAAGLPVQLKGGKL